MLFIALLRSARSRNPRNEVRVTRARVATPERIFWIHERCRLQKIRINATPTRRAYVTMGSLREVSIEATSCLGAGETEGECVMIFLREYYLVKPNVTLSPSVICCLAEIHNTQKPTQMPPPSRREAILVRFLGLDKQYSFKLSEQSN